MAVGFSNWSFLTLLLVSYENATNLLLICIFYHTHTHALCPSFFSCCWKSCKSHVNKLNTIDAKNQTNASFKLNEKIRKKNHASTVVYRWYISNWSRSFPHHMAEDIYIYVFCCAHCGKQDTRERNERTCFFFCFPRSGAHFTST